MAAQMPLRMIILVGAAVAAADICIGGVSSLENGLARTPPMGWLAWERFTCETNCLENPDSCISGQLFRTMADKLVELGFDKLGYQYVNIDDCWSEKEREIGTDKLVADHERFPEGIQSLANYMHDRQLKLGIYGDCGTKTCAGYPAQLRAQAAAANQAAAGKLPPGDDTGNYFDLDASSLAEWQVDSFKFDGCYIDPLKAESICPRMADALRRHTGSTSGGAGGNNQNNNNTPNTSTSSARPILLICEWPFYMMYAHAKPNFTLAGESCNLWRYYDDIEDSWSSILNTIDYTVKHQSTIVKYHGPGHWFDPDQLVIGNFGLSVGQARAQMAIWSVWSAPLYMSNDLRTIDPKFAKILQNEHLIRVDQDRLGVWGQMVQQADNGSLQAFVKPIEPIRNSCPSFAIVYLNRHTLGNTAKMSFKLRDLLLGAPIYQAAKHQSQLLQQSAASSSSSPDSGESSDEQQEETIQAGKCLERLAKAMTKSRRQQQQSDDGQQQSWATQESDEQTSEVNYQVYDLIDDYKHLGQIALDGELELQVDPSSVRAIRIEEKEEQQQQQQQ